MKEFEGQVPDKILNQTEIVNPFHKKKTNRKMGKLFVPTGLFLWCADPEAFFGDGDIHGQENKISKVIFKSTAIDTGKVDIGINVRMKNGKIAQPEKQSTGMIHSVLYDHKMRYVLAINEKNAIRKFRSKHYLI